MRGISEKHTTGEESSGFNPAYAGNIAKCQIHQVTSQVQPRVCGEYTGKMAQLTEAEGSTPRMRGIWLESRIGSTSFRFNPAYAGNITKRHVLLQTIQVQPRVCGEYTKKIMK